MDLAARSTWFFIDMAYYIDNYFSKMEVSPFGPTRSAGVYVVCALTQVTRNFKIQPSDVMYVGQSENIIDRVNQKDHPYRKLFASRPEMLVFTMFYEVQDPSLRKEIEIGLIKEINPPYNVMHNGKKIH